MKKFYINYLPEETRESPMTRSTPNVILPSKVPGKGYPALFVEVEDFIFHFASRAELERCIEVLGKKHLPSLHEEMSQIRNQHWLNRLPSKVKAWNHREKIVNYLKKVQEELNKSTKPSDLKDW